MPSFLPSDPDRAPPLNRTAESDNVTGLLPLDLDVDHTVAWHWLVLCVFPLVCFCGNCLVVCAVRWTKGLQTPTNYLLVSLAIADLMVGTCVMPFAIYTTVNNMHWHLPTWLCHFYCSADVAASTCSILHLVLISMDRLVAATRPADYKTVRHRNRVYVAIACAWVASALISLPLVSGMNSVTRSVLETQHLCGIYNPIYMLCSSMFTFYIPCLVMVATYGYIFRTLRKRLRAIQLQEMAGGQFLGFGADVGNIATTAMEYALGAKRKTRYMISWEKPLLRKIEETAAEHASSLNDSEREQLQTILEIAPSSTTESREATTVAPEPEEERAESVVLDAVTRAESRTSSARLAAPLPAHVKRATLSRRYSEASSTRMSCRPKRRRPRRHSHQPASNLPSSADPDDEEPARKRERGDPNLLRPQAAEKQRRMRRLSEMISEWERPSRTSLIQMYSFARRESIYLARRKLAGLKDWALDLLAKLKSKQGMAIRREKRATSLVTAVLAVFLCCWLPFFALNIVKVWMLWRGEWPLQLEPLFHWFTLLGYLNSSLNVLIYSAINKKFRSSFRRIIRGQTGSGRGKSWMRAAPSEGGPWKSCTAPFRRIAKRATTPLRRANSVGLLNGTGIEGMPHIIIDEISPGHISITAGGVTTIRRTSDGSMRRSSSDTAVGRNTEEALAAAAACGPTVLPLVVEQATLHQVKHLLRVPLDHLEIFV